MPRSDLRAGALIGFAAFTAFATFTALTLPARAEFFGCNDGSSHVTSHYSHYASRTWTSPAVHYSHDFAAHSRRYSRPHVVYQRVGGRWQQRTHW
jgi:hypothetical protein